MTCLYCYFYRTTPSLKFILSSSMFWYSNFFIIHSKFASTIHFILTIPWRDKITNNLINLFLYSQIFPTPSPLYWWIRNFRSSWNIKFWSLPIVICHTITPIIGFLLYRFKLSSFKILSRSQMMRKAWKIISKSML